MLGPLRRLAYRATLGDHRYRFLFEPGPPDELVSLDCETTGLNPRTDEVVAVAAVRIRGNRILTSERFEAVGPGAVAPEDPHTVGVRATQPPAEDRHVVALLPGSAHQRAAEEHRSAEDQHPHGPSITEDRGRARAR